jgi:hypothetical protein
MSLRSCPLCHLIFGSTNELVWHIHNEHHYLTEEEGLKVEVSQAASAQLDEATLGDLVLAVDEGSMSLLLATTPAPQMTSIDLAWLRYLSKSAYRTMAKELHPAVLSKMVPRWEAALSIAKFGHKDKGLAVLVSTKKMAVFCLPFPPRPRVALGISFAVRDLVDALQRFPRYRVLVLGGRRPRILEGWADHLSEVKGPDEPHRESALREADVALADRVSWATDLPLVLIGPARLLSAWSTQSRHSSLLIGSVESHHPDAPARAIAAMAEPLVSAWREAAVAVEVASLGHADRAGLVKWGLGPTWSALSQGTAEHLWVRRDFAAPAIRHGTGWEISPAAGLGARAHTCDVVEELIRAARDVEAKVSFVDKGALPSIEPVGAQLARSRSHRSEHRPGDLPIVDLTSEVWVDPIPEALTQ